jgi:integrase
LQVILKAALNQCYRDGKCASDKAWKACEHFADVNHPRVRYFTRDEITRLLNSAQGDFRLLCKSALFSGARYGELMRLQVKDFESASGTLYIGEAKSGHPRRVHMTPEGLRFFESLTAGRAADTLLLTNDGRPWLDTNQSVPMRMAMQAAGVTDASFHIWRHTAASHWLMSGLPIAVVASNLGHSDSRVTEKHYAHLGASFIADQLRRLGPDFGTVPDSTIVPMTLGK